jgi:hypothetical protein
MWQLAKSESGRISSLKGHLGKPKRPTLVKSGGRPDLNAPLSKKDDTMQIALGLFCLVAALASAFCAGRASGLGRQMEEEGSKVVRKSEGKAEDPEELRRVASAMGKIGEGALAREYTRWVQYAYVWGIAAVVAFFILLTLPSS